MPKVSVIVPVYGVEKYIERCARSLFEQTLDDIEYLFIDDCTPDRSIEVLKSVLEEYPNRKGQVIIHRMEQNSGQASVRKWGMLNATGDYVIHCDSDDWVDVDMYRAMYEKAREDNADIVVCDYCQVDNSGNSFHKICCKSTDRLSFLQDCLLMAVSPSLCNKLVAKFIYVNNIKNIKWPICSQGEDYTLISQLIWFSSKISYVNKCFYFYNYNPTSITRTLTEKAVLKRYDSCKNIALLDNFFSIEQNSKEIRDLLIFAKNNQRNFILPIISNRRYYKIWRNTFREINKQILFVAVIPMKEKLRFILAYCRVYPLFDKLNNRKQNGI